MQKEKMSVKEEKKANTKYFIWLLYSFINTIVVSGIVYFIVSNQNTLERLITINKNNQMLQFMSGFAVVVFAILIIMNLGLIVFFNDIESKIK